MVLFLPPQFLHVDSKHFWASSSTWHHLSTTTVPIIYSFRVTFHRSFSSRIRAISSFPTSWVFPTSSFPFFHSLRWKCSPTILIPTCVLLHSHFIFTFDTTDFLRSNPLLGFQIVYLDYNLMTPNEIFPLIPSSRPPSENQIQGIIFPSRSLNMIPFKLPLCWKFRPPQVSVEQRFPLFLDTVDSNFIQLSNLSMTSLFLVFARKLTELTCDSNNWSAMKCSN